MKERRAAPEAHIRRLLRRTWYPFFARFGRLTPTQCEAIPAIHSGADMLLSAPTATGKTEAAAAPALERILAGESGSGTPSLLFVAPTRALCNDLARRLRPPVSRCGLRLDLKTGDAPRLSSASPPHVLVTTPESLDSMLCRRTRFLRSVQTVVFDELHLVHGSARGDQVMCLSHRLERIAPELQRCATSATVPHVERVARAYLGARAQTVHISAGQRGLAVEHAEADGVHEAEHYLRALHERAPGDKILVFANRRADVEWLGARLADIGALCHHGSLSRERRLAVERRFLNAPSGMCMATMTLEVGVDIGDIDRVVLVEPPADVCSFRQRVGRANRRSGQMHVSLLHQSSAQLTRFEHMLDCVREGKLFDQQTVFRPAVVAQQAVSLAYQNPARWISAEALFARLPWAGRATTSVADCRDVLAALETSDWLYPDAHGRFSPDESGLRAFETGQMHCNIAPDGGVEVIDETTRRTLGSVSRRYLKRDDDHFAIGGCKREISRVRDARVFVHAQQGGEDVVFDSAGAPRLSFDYCQDLARFLHVPTRTFRYAPRGDGIWCVEHFLGTLWGEVFAGVMQKRGFAVRHSSPFTVVIRRGSGGPPRQISEMKRVRRDVKRALRARHRRLEQMLQPGPFHRLIPEDQRHEWLEECVDVEAFVEQLTGSEFERVNKLALGD